MTRHFPVLPVSDIQALAVIPIGGSPDWVAVDEEGVWISNKEECNVSLISPQSNSLVRQVAMDGHPCSGLACGFGSIWAPTCDPGSLVRLDGRSGATTARIELQVSDSEGGLAVDDFGVWIVSESSDALLRIDPLTNHIAGRITIDDGSHVVVSGDGKLWTSSSLRNRVTCIDPATGRVEGVISVGPQPRFMCCSLDSLWVLNQGDGSVSRIGFAERRVVASVEVGVPGRGGDIDFGHNSIWVTAIDTPLTRIDAESGRVIVQYTGRGGDALRTGFGSVWLSSFILQEVWRIDPGVCLPSSSPMVNRRHLPSAAVPATSLTGSGEDWEGMFDALTDAKGRVGRHSAAPVDPSVIWAEDEGYD